MSGNQGALDRAKAMLAAHATGDRAGDMDWPMIVTADDLQALSATATPASDGVTAGAEARLDAWHSEWLESNGDHWGDRIEWGTAREIVRRLVDTVPAVPTPDLFGEGYRAGEWQDIASAPKDGTEVDLWGAFRGSKPARVPDCAWLTLASGPDWYARGDNGWESLGAINWVATHWRPLPAPPPIRALEPDAGEGA